MVSSISLLLFLNCFLIAKGTVVTTFTFVNKCGFTVWPGILSNAGHPPLPTTGFELPSAASRSVPSPVGWSGRIWARTGCAFDNSSRGACATGDCGAGGVECSGKGAAPPVTLAEFTLGDGGGLDFYDVSLVDGYNLPLVVAGGGGRCAETGCAVDVNRRCPAELRVGEGQAVACRSACEAFGKPEYCCRGDFASPQACRPTAYSKMFKEACPKSYSYAYDDATSTFTCSAAGEYTITFCPDSTPSEKSSRDSPTAGGGLALESDTWLASLAYESDATPKSVAISSLLASFVAFSGIALPFLMKT
ncbi:hypothetical protein HPP92_013007 [Vanilla planifolia]|uniref:Uncharacterized protein n=1 Tax=Vanilla planifolia TaxID=51239 RepID=A0A835QML4_VANPL|nr:hypothetical protein HPP92_013007 [Vanilla planifolia]